jgi:hypothetical protein
MQNVNSCFLTLFDAPLLICVVRTATLDETTEPQEVILRDLDRLAVV